MKRLLIAGVVLVVLAVAGAVAMNALTPTVKLETMDVKPVQIEQTGMCPWRNPKADMAAFFPGATTYRTAFLVLSDHSLEVAHRIGHPTTIQTNGLYMYPVLSGSTELGRVLVQRFAAPHGAMEAVVGVAPDGKIAGVRVQRLREPGDVTQAVTSTQWLGAFRGLTVDSPFQIGNDLPQLPVRARETAAAFADAVRVLMIEYDTGKRHGDLNRRK
jgi:hypothetical protein